MMPSLCSIHRLSMIPRTHTHFHSKAFTFSDEMNKNDWLTERKCLSHILFSAKNFPQHDMCRQSSLETSDYDDGRTMSCHNHKFTIEQQQQAEKITHSSFLSVLLSFNTIFRCYCARLFITSSYQEMECMYFRRNQLLFISRHSNYISHTCERWMTKQSSHSHRTANWNWCALLTRKTWAFFYLDISYYQVRASQTRDTMRPMMIALNSSCCDVDDDVNLSFDCLSWCLFARALLWVNGRTLFLCLRVSKGRTMDAFTLSWAPSHVTALLTVFSV